jgi:hypothetical protein
LAFYKVRHLVWLESKKPFLFIKKGKGKTNNHENSKYNSEHIKLISNIMPNNFAFAETGLKIAKNQKKQPN